MGPVMQHDANSRPDFAAPIYPAYRTATPVPDDAPPLFIVIADDDQLISPNSSARLYMAWHTAGHSAELHIFRRGKHGNGARGARHDGPHVMQHGGREFRRPLVTESSAQTRLHAPRNRRFGENTNRNQLNCPPQLEPVPAVQPKQ